MYAVAFDLLYSPLEYYPDSIIEWSIAHNLLKKNVNIQQYTINMIKSMSSSKLRELANILTMKTSDIGHIINILKYLHKIKSELDLFPSEMIIEIMKSSDFNDIESLCNTSTKITKICETNEFRNMLIDKLSYDSFDLSNFNIKQLLFYSKIIKRKMSLEYFSRINILSDNSLTILNVYDHFPDQINTFKNTNINKIISLSFDYLILDNEGKIFFVNNHYMTFDKKVSIDLFVNDENINNTQFVNIFIDNKGIKR